MGFNVIYTLGGRTDGEKAETVCHFGHSCDCDYYYRFNCRQNYQ